MLAHDPDPISKVSATFGSLFAVELARLSVLSVIFNPPLFDMNLPPEEHAGGKMEDRNIGMDCQSILSEKSPLHAYYIQAIAERAARDPLDLSLDEIKELGLAVVAHLRADPRL